MTKEYVRINEFAEIAGHTVATLYSYHANRMYDFPPADLKIGVVLFWKRATATAWSKKRR
jgi:predicted DNA-binding transcriptional regulator AlpA